MEALPVMPGEGYISQSVVHAPIQSSFLSKSTLIIIVVVLTILVMVCLYFYVNKPKPFVPNNHPKQVLSPDPCLEELLQTQHDRNQMIVEYTDENDVSDDGDDIEENVLNEEIVDNVEYTSDIEHPNEESDNEPDLDDLDLIE